MDEGVVVKPEGQVLAAYAATDGPDEFCDILASASTRVPVMEAMESVSSVLCMREVAIALYSGDNA